MKQTAFLAVILLFFISPSCDNSIAQSSNSFKQLEEAFLHPPETAKPWTWWHWISGNITKQGITHDLENMKRAGLGGVIIFNVKRNLPDGRVRFMSSEWMDLLEHAVSECDRLGLKLGINSCDGWSQAGGPWITPELSMKRLVWSKTYIRGPERFSNRLPQPLVPVSPYVKNFYREVAVIAYPTLEGRRINGPGSGIFVNGTASEDELNKLFDSDLQTRTSFRLGSQHLPVKNMVMMQFPAPVTAQSLVLHGIKGYEKPQVIPGKLEVSDNGLDFREVATFELNWSLRDDLNNTITVAFPEVRGKVFRFSFKGKHVFSKELSLAELELSTVPAVHYWEAKAGWVRHLEHGGETPFFIRDPGPEYGQLGLFEEGIVPLDQVLVFRGELNNDGHFELDIPEGNWTILRIGYTSTGHTNAPATQPLL